MTHKNDFLEMADRDEERVHLGGKAVFDQDLLGGSAPKSGKKHHKYSLNNSQFQELAICRTLKLEVNLMKTKKKLTQPICQNLVFARSDFEIHQNFQIGSTQF